MPQCATCGRGRWRRPVDGEVCLVDFSEALKARIKTMSPTDLAAAEAGHRPEVGGELSQLEGVWEPIGGGAQPPVTKPLTVRFEAATIPSRDTLTVLQGSTWQEAIVLTPLTYRLLAGGQGEDEARPSALNERFVIVSDAGGERISTDRVALAAFVAQTRPAEMDRAARLHDRERLHLPTARLALSKRLRLFADRWTAEDLDLRVDAAVSRAPSRTVLLMTGRDHVALWVRPADLAGVARILEPDLAAAILRPAGAAAAQPHPMIQPSASPLEADLFGAVGHGSGPERVLLIDLKYFRKSIVGMPTDAQRDAALVALENMVSRSAVVGDERNARLRRGAAREKRRA